MAGSSQYRFGVLAKIVKHMRLRHLDGDDHPLSLDDILDETNQLDIGSSVKNVRFCTYLIFSHTNNFKNFRQFNTVVTDRSIAKQSKN